MKTQEEILKELLEQEKVNFWSKVDIKTEDECWEYKSMSLMQHYGTFMRSRLLRRKRTYHAHRFAYALGNNLQIEDLKREDYVCHTCDNTACCNPKHLKLGTQQDNMKDAVAKGRIAKGSGIGNSILREQDVKDIKKLLSEGISQQKISEMYKVSRPTITYISTGRNWKHVA